MEMIAEALAAASEGGSGAAAAAAEAPCPKPQDYWHSSSYRCAALRLRATRYHLFDFFRHGFLHGFLFRFILLLRLVVLRFLCEFLLFRVRSLPPLLCLFLLHPYPIPSLRPILSSLSWPEAEQPFSLYFSRLLRLCADGAAFGCLAVAGALLLVGGPSSATAAAASSSSLGDGRRRRGGGRRLMGP